MVSKDGSNNLLKSHFLELKKCNKSWKYNWLNINIRAAATLPPGFVTEHRNLTQVLFFYAPEKKPRSKKIYKKKHFWVNRGKNDKKCGWLELDIFYGCPVVVGHSVHWFVTAMTMTKRPNAWHKAWMPSRKIYPGSSRS